MLPWSPDNSTAQRGVEYAMRKAECHPDEPKHQHQNRGLPFPISMNYTPPDCSRLFTPCILVWNPGTWPGTWIRGFGKGNARSRLGWTQVGRFWFTSAIVTAVRGEDFLCGYKKKFGFERNTRCVLVCHGALVPASQAIFVILGVGVRLAHERNLETCFQSAMAVSYLGSLKSLVNFTLYCLPYHGFYVVAVPPHHTTPSYHWTPLACAMHLSAVTPVCYQTDIIFLQKYRTRAAALHRRLGAQVVCYMQAYGHTCIARRTFCLEGGISLSLPVPTSTKFR